jgi:hypothetical protein
LDQAKNAVTKYVLDVEAAGASRLFGIKNILLAKVL